MLVSMINMKPSKKSQDVIDKQIDRQTDRQTDRPKQRKVFCNSPLGAPQIPPPSLVCCVFQYTMTTRQAATPALPLQTGKTSTPRAGGDTPVIKLKVTPPLSWKMGAHLSHTQR